MAKKDFTGSVDNLFIRHADKAEEINQSEEEKKQESTPQELPLDVNVKKEDGTAPVSETETTPKPAETQQKPKQTKQTKQAKQQTKKAVGTTKKVPTARNIVKEESEEPQIYINRTYSLSRKIVNAITDYAYHNKVDKNTIVNTALKEFLGEYYDNAEN